MEAPPPRGQRHFGNVIVDNLTMTLMPIGRQQKYYCSKGHGALSVNRFQNMHSKSRLSNFWAIPRWKSCGSYLHNSSAASTDSMHCTTQLV
jgi:hypothetical protein